jgi:hypothetical protein
MAGHVLGRLTPDAGAILKLYTEGVSLDDLGIRWHCHPSTIRRFLVSHDVPIRKTPLKRKLNEQDVIKALEAGWDVREVARLFKVRPEAVRQFLVTKSIAISD